MDRGILLNYQDRRSDKETGQEILKIAKSVQLVAATLRPRTISIYYDILVIGNKVYISNYFPLTYRTHILNQGHTASIRSI